MDNKVIIEVSNGEVVALHSNKELDFHIVDWDNKGDELFTWEERCKTPLEADRYIDKTFDYYMNEVLNA